MPARDEDQGRNSVRERLSRFFPFLGWLGDVGPRTLRADLIAGLTGAVIVLPQGVAFAIIAGLPPEYGLYSAIVPAIVAALFGSSSHLISGPTTAISIVVFTTISPLAARGTPEYLSLGADPHVPRRALPARPRARAPRGAHQLRLALGGDRLHRGRRDPDRDQPAAALLRPDDRRSPTPSCTRGWRSCASCRSPTRTSSPSPPRRCSSRCCSRSSCPARPGC